MSCMSVKAYIVLSPRAMPRVRNRSGAQFENVTSPEDAAAGLCAVQVIDNDGRSTTFKVNNNALKEKEDFCIICSESLHRGSLAALPHCGHCNKESIVMHTTCARRYLMFDVPKDMRPAVKHLICQDTHLPGPPVLSYMACVDTMHALDARGVPAGRCDDCKMPLSTRQGHLLHKNPEHPLADHTMMHADERELLEREPDLFRCPLTHAACEHCGFMDTAAQLVAHEEVCATLTAEERSLVKCVLSRSARFAFAYSSRSRSCARSRRGKSGRSGSGRSGSGSSASSRRSMTCSWRCSSRRRRSRRRPKAAP